MKKTIVLSAGLFLASSLLYAGDTVGTSSAIFLKKAVGARAAAMGEAYTSITNDPAGVFFNPGSLGFQEKPALSTMYQTGLADISMGSLIYAHPFDRWGTVGIGVLYSDAGTIEVNLPGQALRNREALKDTAYTLGYGKAFANLISLGLNAKLIQSTLVEEYSDSTTSLDAGLLITPRLKGLQIGLSFLNIGKGLTYISESDPLPQTTRAGLSYTYYHLTQDEILYAFLLTADGYKTLDEQTKSGIGLEIMRNTFSIRAGYLLNKDIEGLTAGLGFGWSRYTLDYAIGFVEDLSHNHRISLNIHFAPIASELETNKQNFQHRPKNLGAQ